MDPPARRGPAPQAGPALNPRGQQMKIAILGLGSIGRRHLGNFRIAGVETLTAYDAASAEAALEGVDGAVICTPPESHIALGRMAAERCAHHIVEMPSAQSVQGAEH